VVWDVVCPVHRTHNFDVPPEDDNFIAETYVGVTNIPYCVNNSCALVGVT
jgi:hypothetical protein